MLKDALSFGKLPPTLIIGSCMFGLLILFSDTIVGVFVGIGLTVWVSLLIFAPKYIDERIEENQREWLTTHKRLPERLEEPRDWRRQAVLFWMFSWLLFALQLVIQGSNNPFASSDLDDIAFWLGMVFLALGSFRAYHIGEFLGNRNYYPRIGISVGIALVGISLIAIGYSTILATLLPYFAAANWVGKLFMLMIPPTVLDSVILGKFILDKRKHSHAIMNLLAYGMLIPLAFLFVFALVSALL